MQPDDNSELGAFRLQVDTAFVQMIADIVQKECPDQAVSVNAHRRYLRATKNLPDGTQAVLHGHLTWSYLYHGDGGQGDYFLIEVDLKDDSEDYRILEPLTPRHIANKVLEILSQLNGTP